MYKTKLTAQPTEGQKFTQQSKVDEIGYVSTEDRIKNILMSGRQLELARANQFDFKNLREAIESEIPFDRRQNLDLADVTEEQRNLSEKMQERREEEIRAKEALQEATEPHTDEHNAPKEKDVQNIEN